MLPRLRGPHAGNLPGRRGRAGAVRSAAGALVAYLRHAQHLPTARLRDVLRELHGAALSTGTVEALCRRAVRRLAPAVGDGWREALAMPAACMDETSLRVAGVRVWLHVICDERTTLYRLGPRGAVWTEYTGTAVHDRLACYWSRLPAQAEHAVCNAHLLRNLEEMVEREPTPDRGAARMQRRLLAARDTARDWLDRTGGPVPAAVRAATAAAWDALLEPVLAHYGERPPPARGGRRRGHNLALALWELRDDCLRFMADPRVPSPHNRAERALRMAKLHMKISGGFRTRAGAGRFAQMRGLIETARQRERDLLEFLRTGPEAPEARPVPPWNAGGEPPPPPKLPDRPPGVPEQLLSGSDCVAWGIVNAGRDDWQASSQGGTLVATTVRPTLGFWIRLPPEWLRSCSVEQSLPMESAIR